MNTFPDNLQLIIIHCHFSNSWCYSTKSIRSLQTFTVFYSCKQNASVTNKVNPILFNYILFHDERFQFHSFCNFFPIVKLFFSTIQNLKWNQNLETQLSQLLRCTLSRSPQNLIYPSFLFKLILSKQWTIEPSDI